MEKVYKEVDLEMIELLKAKGYGTIQLVLQPPTDRYRATVEVIPEMGKEFALDKIQLNSSEILHYFDGPSPMARYIIDQTYL